MAALGDEEVQENTAPTLECELVEMMARDPETLSPVAAPEGNPTEVDSDSESEENYV